jgi:hypothetical protein
MGLKMVKWDQWLNYYMGSVGKERAFELGFGKRR